MHEGDTCSSVNTFPYFSSKFQFNPTSLMDLTLLLKETISMFMVVSYVFKDAQVQVNLILRFCRWAGGRFYYIYLQAHMPPATLN